jgi:NAD(P)-dependent dehydrogenase (short-subunit alcohol dehydrogenase family)
VSKPASVEACAAQVYDRYGVCHLLFNNAGVGGGGVAKPWNWTPNDWKWCIGVNVFGVGNCVHSFVPRMIEGGEEGWVVNTSSDNGGIQPMADLAVYAASKAAVTAITECLANAFRNEGTAMHAAVFYPGGNGLLETRLWNSGRNRPPELAREYPHVDAQWDYQEHKSRMEASGVQVADLVELGRFVLQGIRDERFVIKWDTQSSADLLAQRAELIRSGALPTVERGGAFR